MKIILASASPRREKILRKLVGNVLVKPAHIDEKIRAGEGFVRACVRLAKAKAECISDAVPLSLVIGADTIAYKGRKIYRKTDDERAARKILRELSGKTHYVITGVAIAYPSREGVCYYERSSVKMKKLSADEIELYLKAGDWQGRAGCYDISGKGAALVEKVIGEKETVIGLPIKKLKGLLRKAKRQ